MLDQNDIKILSNMFGKLEARFDEKLDKLEARFDEKLDKLETRFDEKLETKIKSLTKNWKIRTEHLRKCYERIRI